MERVDIEKRWELGHRPALDGLRGVAIGLVLLGHATVPGFFWSAQVGVALFFALSGFLITALLLEELRRTGRVSLRGFYARRLRRLGPAFLACVAVAGLLGFAVRGTGFVTPRDVLLSLSYFGNWYPALLAHPQFTPLGGLSGTWSLAVEEQFYLVWPVVLILAVSRWGTRGLWWVAAGGAALSIGTRLWLVTGGATESRVYFGTDTNAVGLLAGAALAVVLHRSSGLRLPLWPLVAALGGIGFASTLTHVSWNVIVLVAAGCSLAVIAVSATSDHGWLEWGWLRWLGRRSYAVYLWNCLITAALFYIDLPWPIRLVAIVVPSLLIAELSWRCVESPVLVRRAEVTARRRSRSRTH